MDDEDTTRFYLNRVSSYDWIKLIIPNTKSAIDLRVNVEMERPSAIQRLDLKCFSDCLLDRWMTLFVTTMGEGRCGT